MRKATFADLCCDRLVPQSVYDLLAHSSVQLNWRHCVCNACRYAEVNAFSVLFVDVCWESALGRQCCHDGG